MINFSLTFSLYILPILRVVLQNMLDCATKLSVCVYIYIYRERERERERERIKRWGPQMNHFSTRCEIKHDCAVTLQPRI